MPMLLAVDITVDTILRFSAGKEKESSRRNTPQKMAWQNPLTAQMTAMLKKEEEAAMRRLAADVTAVARMIYP